MFKKVTYDDAVNNRIFNDSVSKRIAIVMPAFNEADAISKALDSIVDLNKPHGLILDVFIALDNCTDNTEEVVETYKDKLNLYVLDTVDNHDKKVGALNQVYRLFFGDLSESADDLSDMHKKVVDNIVAFLGIDADVYLDKNCLINLYQELNAKFNIGSVSANYTCLMPESKRRLRRDNPNAEYEIKNGNYSGALGWFITAQQNKSFAQWTLEQKHNGFAASIAGGQCTLFRPKALHEVFDTYKLNGIYDNETDTEDSLLTQQMRSIGWRPMISNSARCYVDSMKTMKAYVNQNKKWTTGKLDYTTKAGLSTQYSRKNWVEEVTLFMNGIIRIMLLALVPTSIMLGRFSWSWIWALPFAFSVILNTIIAFKVPRKRFVDILLSITTISAEFSIWFDLYVHIKSWRELSKVERVDGWEQQYLAEQGSLKSNHIGFIAFTLLVIAIIAGIYFKFLSINTALQAVEPYVSSGFTLLTYMTIVTTILMFSKLLKIRGNFKA